MSKMTIMTKIKVFTIIFSTFSRSFLAFKTFEIILFIILPTLFTFYLLLACTFLKSISEIILIAIPWVLITNSYGIIFCQDTLYHLLNLSLTIFYFKLKLSHLNHQIKELLDVPTFFSSAQQLISVHQEIQTSNSTFWSKYFAILIIFYLVGTNVLIYNGIFGQFNLIIRCFILYWSAFMFFIYSAFIIGPSINRSEYNLFIKVNVKLL